jgi:hypothetical protein
MTLRSSRLATRVGAAALLTAGALAFTAAPASANADVDLAVSFTSAKIASDSVGKFVYVQVTNIGDKKADGFDVSISIDRVDGVAVSLPSSLDDFCEPDGADAFKCEFGNVLVKHDQLEIPVAVQAEAGFQGPGGKISATVTSGQDTATGNNSGSVDIEVVKKGVDLVLWADDIVASRDEDTGELKGVKPGDVANLNFFIANAGSLAAGGLDLKIELPEHVTFTADEVDGCELDSAKRVLTCHIEDFILEPNEQIDGELEVKIAASAPNPSALKGKLAGKALEALKPSEEEEPAEAESETAPLSWAKVTSNGTRKVEIDKTDNIDEFTIFVGNPSTGGGGGGLPVTGARAGLVGGVGAAVVVLGAVLFLVARRRRLVMVTPAE